MRWSVPLLMLMPVILSACEGTQSAGKVHRSTACPEAAYSEAEQLGIDRADIEKLTVSSIRGGNADQPLLGYNAWLSLNSCEGGSLIVELTTSCTVRQTYTRGKCQVPGVRHF